MNTNEPHPDDYIRLGNWGGWGLFNWDDVWAMNYKDWELYLGGTQALGYLDKTGKWRSSDWWTKE